MEIALSILVGIGLAAACGFRVFVPFFVVCVAAMSGHLELAPGFDWMGTHYALIAFAAATLLEVVAYYVPWLDNLLDAIATPAAVAAGIVITASVVGDMSPFLRWTLAVIAGGGTAAAVQTASVALRGTSTATTGGLANPVVSTGELGGSAVVATLAVVLPIVAIALVIIMGAFLVRLRRWSRRA